MNTVSGEQKITPLMTACSVGSELVISLIKRGADVGMRDARGTNPVIFFHSLKKDGYQYTICSYISFLK